MKKYSCFVISPIGEEGTEIYQEYTDLFDLIIVPAMEVFDMEVARGDHFVSDELIDASVIAQVQSADICICDISIPNPNVYYELGRRDETGKPVILLKKKGSPPSPVDIATRRYIEYDYEGRYAIREAQNHIREMAEPYISEGFEKTGRSATLGDLADSLARLERKVDKLFGGIGNGNVVGTPPPTQIDFNNGSGDEDPLDQFKYALRNRNIPLAEKAMQQLQYRMDTIKFYDIVVEQVAAMGSTTAGNMLIEYAEVFIYNESISFQKKVEYISCLVGYANKKDLEQECLSLLEVLFEHLLNVAQAESATNKQEADVYNQKNRLYYGIFFTTGDPSWLDKALEALGRAMELCAEDNSYYYNTAVCYMAYAKKTGDSDYYVKAKSAIDDCLGMDKEPDDDHLQTACKIYYKLGDSRFEEIFKALQEVSPYMAANLADDIKKGRI